MREFAMQISYRDIFSVYKMAGSQQTKGQKSM